MLNQVAEAVEKEFPDVLVESLAYQYTRKPPKTIKPRDNVLDSSVHDRVFLHPAVGRRAEPEVRRGHRRLEQAGQVPVHLGLYDQLQRLSRAASQPARSRPNVRYFVKHGAIGLFEEGEGDDFCELKNWLLMRVMWEPDLDADKLIDEFVRGYYGEAVAPLVKQYWDVLIAQAERRKSISAASA